MSENAVKTQVWISIAVYVLVTIVKKRMNSEVSLYTILQIFSLTLFENIQIDQLVNISGHNDESDQLCNQLNLYN